MKKFFSSLSVLASLLVAAGCTTDDAATAESDFTSRYMAVRIVSTDGNDTRDDILYEDGSTTENKVSSVRFYFFTENGAAANVKLSPDGTSYLNYYEWTPAEGDQITSNDPTNHTESHLAATVVINTHEGDKLPRTMVAILNPADKLTSSSAQGLNTIRGISNDYAAAGLTQEGKFVMSNSVYGEGTSPVKEVCAVFIENDNLCETAAKAKDNPVTIYVERNVAKVAVSLSDDLNKQFSKDRLALTYKDQTEITIGKENEAKPVYLQLKGWALTAETDKGYLVKRINTQWDTEWWNEGVHRCTWAMNSREAKNKYLSTYNSINKVIGTDYLYTNENAAPFSDGTYTNTLEHTKFIVAGTLCDESGNALTLVRHMGELFTDTYSSTESDNFPELKKSILSYLEEDYPFWKADGSGRSRIAPTDIAIAPNTVVAKENSNNNCYVYASLTAEAEKAKWYSSETGTEEVAAADINAVLKNREIVGEALVWRDGQTYYYKEIVHRDYVSTTPPTPGVVRNHVYRAKITDISGLGTPVYDPDAVIYPEKPDKDDHYIAAKIDILSWRLISDNYSLDW